MQLVQILSTAFDDLKRRIPKFKRFGNSDVQTSFEASPYGIDSNPIKGMVAVYSETSEKGKTVVVGYLNKNQLAKPGETRLYSTNDSGELKIYCWLKDDGTIEFGGNTDNLIRYEKLNIALQAQVDLLNTELAKIAVVLNTLSPGSYTLTPIELDISTAKIEELKTL